MLNDQLLQLLCNKYNISADIPKAYYDYLKKDGHYYLDIPCGTGKTIGLAIMAACSKDVSFIYVASTHSRLREFVDTLSLFKVEFYYLIKSAEVLPYTPTYEIIKRSRIIVMTSSMLLQIPIDWIRLCWVSKRETLHRGLVIDELPKILLPILYNNISYPMIESYDTDNWKYSCYTDCNNNIDNENFEFVFDGALNYTETRLYAKKRKLYYARSYFFRLLKGRKIAIPKNNPDETKDFLTCYLSIMQTYLQRVSTSIVLDATADLYGSLLQSVEMKVDIPKDYNQFINIFSYGYLGDGFKQRDDILGQMLSLSDTFKSELSKYPGPYYLVSHNSGLYDGMGSEKVADKELISHLEKTYKQVYVDDNRDYILCRDDDTEIKKDDFGKIICEDNDLLISNFGRSRGSNFFRNCRTVWLLGTFFLPNNELSEMISQNHFNIDSKQLQTNLAIADAVQEISRGCLRKRDKNNKMNIIMTGDKSVIDGVMKYLNINGTEIK